MRSRFVRVVALLLVATACANNSDAAEPDTPTTAEEVPTADVSTTEAITDTTIRADIADYCAIEQARFELDPSDPESVEAGFTLNLAEARKRVELAPPEIAVEQAILLEGLEQFVDELREAGWSLEDLPPDAGEIDQVADNKVTDFQVEHCGIEDPRQP